MNLVSKAKLTAEEYEGMVNERNINNAKVLLDSGADVLVAGSFVFKSENPELTIQELKAVS